MKYIKPFNENEELVDNIKHMLLPISDDLKVYPNLILTSNPNIYISGSIGNTDTYKVFLIDDYIDEIKRVIDYLKDHNYLFNICSIYETEEDSQITKIPYSNRDLYKHKEYKNISNIYGKRCVCVQFDFIHLK